MSNYEIMHGDCIEQLRKIRSGSIDLIVTDPAYESLEKHRSKGTTTRLKQSAGSSNAWFSIFRDARFPDLMAELYRVLAKDAHLYVFADEETTFNVTKPTGVAAGFTWWKAIVWVKTLESATDGSEDVDELAKTTAIGMGYHWRNSHEFVGFLEKGKRRLNNLGWASVIPAKRVRDGYPTEKPVSILERLILNSSNEGMTVLDPFMGSGSCGEAALKHGRNFIGIDVALDSITKASARLAEHGVNEQIVQFATAPHVPKAKQVTLF
jgi:site-specific DNA-methyltransferase (adenine-specific)